MRDAEDKVIMSLSIVDIIRFDEDGKYAEHWDVVQEQAVDYDAMALCKEEEPE